MREIEPGEMRGHRRRRACAARVPVPRAAPRPLHLRARLLRAPGLRAVRRSRSTRCARRSAGSWRSEQPGGGGRRHPGARLRRARGASATRRSSGIPYDMGLIRSHYVGPHLHRAAAVDPPLRREAEAEPGARGAARASAWWSSTTPSCAAPPVAEDREDAARPRARARCTCASPARRPRWPCYYGIDTPTRAGADRLQPLRRRRSPAT